MEGKHIGRVLFAGNAEQRGSSPVGFSSRVFPSFAAVALLASRRSPHLIRPTLNPATRAADRVRSHGLENTRAASIVPVVSEPEIIVAAQVDALPHYIPTPLVPHIVLIELEVLKVPRGRGTFIHDHHGLVVVERHALHDVHAALCAATTADWAIEAVLNAMVQSARVEVLPALKQRRITSTRLRRNVAGPEVEGDPNEIANVTEDD